MGSGTEKAGKDVESHTRLIEDKKECAMIQTRTAMRALAMSVAIFAAAMVAGQTLPQAIAHRGGGGEQDENTLEAIRNSYEKGVRGFEIDVQFTKDRRVVLLHDQTLNRTTTGTGAVGDKTSTEIGRIRTRKSNQPLPYLEEVFDFLKDRKGTFIVLELKTMTNNDELANEMAATLADLMKRRFDPERVIFQGTWEMARKIKAKIPGQKFCVCADKPCPSFMGNAKKAGASFASIRLKEITPELVKEAHNVGITIAAWTIKTPEDAHLAVDLGVDSVFTDIPAQQLERKTARP